MKHRRAYITHIMLLRAASLTHTNAESICSQFRPIRNHKDKLIRMNGLPDLVQLSHLFHTIDGTSTVAASVSDDYAGWRLHAITAQANVGSLNSTPPGASVPVVLFIAACSLSVSCSTSMHVTAPILPNVSNPTSILRWTGAAGHPLFEEFISIHFVRHLIRL